VRKNKGWTYAKVLLTHERTNIAGVARAKTRRLNALRKLAAESSDGYGKTINEKSDVQKKRLAECEIELQALEYSELRNFGGHSVWAMPLVQNHRFSRLSAPSWRRKLMS
jgi:alkylation response protein AidB-like acyl-CoA dehydrogenase